MAERTVPTQSFMDAALEEARVAAQAGEVPIGCVVVCDGEVIAQSGNRTLSERDPTAHAEMVAIRRAAEALGGDLVRAHPAPLLRRRGSQGRRGRKWRALFLGADLPASAGNLWRHRRNRSGVLVARLFFRPAVTRSPTRARATSSPPPQAGQGVDRAR